jgi:hypothetical protein
MPNPTFATPLLMMLLAGPAVAPAAAPAPVAPPDWNRAVALAQHITIHVPRVTVTRTTTIITRPAAPDAARAPPPPMFREKKADNCVKMKKVVGFSVTTNDAIDLVLDDGTRLRARLASDCRALGFYSGFYVKPNPDGKICTKRDLLRSRMGKGCAIGQFSKLIPVR